MFNQRELAQTRYIQLHAKRMLIGFAAGASPTRSDGFGFDFDRLRDYVPGDDVRFVDWRASARAGSLLTRCYRQERNRTVLICLDASASCFTGSGAHVKFSLMAHLAGLCAYIAAYNQDAVGLCVVRGDHASVVVPPALGFVHARRIVDRVCSYTYEKTSDCSWNGALVAIRALAKKQALCMIISDFLSDYSPLSLLACLHECALFRVRDYVDVYPEHLDGWSVHDQSAYYISTKQARDMQNFADSYWKEQERFFVRHGIDCCDIISQKYTFATLRKFFMRSLVGAARGV